MEAESTTKVEESQAPLKQEPDAEMIVEENTAPGNLLSTVRFTI
jgi:hypothetical protein